MDSPQPTREEFDQLKTEVADLREEVAAIAGALNALVVVWRTHLLGKATHAADTSEVPKSSEDQ